MADRTNIEAVMAVLVSETMAAEWVDRQGNPAEPCTLDEAHAVVSTVIETMFRNSTSKERFLINLAALLGGRMLMTTSRMRVAREETMREATKYSSTWEYRLGSVRGGFSMTQVVGHEKWRPAWAAGIAGEVEEAASDGGREEGEGAAYWKKKYEDLAGTLRKQERQQDELKERIVSSLRGGR
jgi:hypothetical protein